MSTTTTGCGREIDNDVLVGGVYFLLGQFVILNHHGIVLPIYLHYFTFDLYHPGHVHLTC